MVTLKRYFHGLRKPNWHLRWWHFLMMLLIACLVLLVVRGLLLTQMSVPQSTGHPTLMQGDRILVNRLAYGLRLPFTFGRHQQHVAAQSPQRGEWCVIEQPNHPGVYTLEQITAIPGDHIKISTNDADTCTLKPGMYATKHEIVQHRHLVGRPFCTTYSLDASRPFGQRLRTDRFFISLP